MELWGPEWSVSRGSSTGKLSHGKMNFPLHRYSHIQSNSHEHAEELVSPWICKLYHNTKVPIVRDEDSPFRLPDLMISACGPSKHAIHSYFDSKSIQLQLARYSFNEAYISCKLKFSAACRFSTVDIPIGISEEMWGMKMQCTHTNTNPFTHFFTNV